MASINLQGDTSGSISISAPSVAGSNTLTLPATTQTLATQNALGVRNLIINGDMRIAQRGTSATGLTGAGYHTVDRFRTALGTCGTWTQTQDTDVPSGQGLSTSLKLDCTTANTSLSASSLIAIEQRFEGQNLQHLKYGTSSAESMTLSFWVKSNKTGTYIAEFYSSDNSKQISKSYTIDTADTWEKKTITYAGDTVSGFDNDNNNSMTLYMWFAAGSTFSSGTLNTSWASLTNANRVVGQVNLADSTSNYINITGVQLEVGDTATPFEHRPWDMEFARCQRYFQTSYYYGSTIGSGFTNGSYSAIQMSWGSSNASSIAGGTWKLPVMMRINGTLTVYDQAGTSGKYTKLNAGASATNGATPNQVVTSQHQFQLRSYNNGGHGLEFTYTLDAEL